MTKTLLDCGNCGPDYNTIRKMVKSHFDAAVIQTHGGPDDAYRITENWEIINMEYCAKASCEYLTAHNRTVIDCPHTYGHTNHPNIGGTTLLPFFKAHKSGTSSPYADSGLPSYFPSVCRLVR